MRDHESTKEITTVRWEIRCFSFVLMLEKNMSLEVDNDAFISSNNKSEDPLQKTTIRVVLNVKFNLKKLE